jgi:hypothetical protein
MTYCANRKTFLGSAGILPAATGMLPVAFFSRRVATVSICFQGCVKLSGRMPDRAGNMPALPFTILIPPL